MDSIGAHCGPHDNSFLGFMCEPDEIGGVIIVEVGVVVFKFRFGFEMADAR